MTLKEILKKNLNVPNVLSLIRLLLVPVYLILFVRGQKTAALVVFAAACFTDLLDGRIARRSAVFQHAAGFVQPGGAHFPGSDDGVHPPLPPNLK